jgi:hypothetical protein
MGTRHGTRVSVGIVVVLSLAVVGLTVTGALAAPSQKVPSSESAHGASGLESRLIPVTRSPTPLPSDPPDITEPAPTVPAPASEAQESTFSSSDPGGDPASVDASTGNPGPPPGAPTITVAPPTINSIDPQPTITAYDLEPSCGGETASVYASVSATGGHPDITEASLVTQVDGGPASPFMLGGGFGRWFGFDQGIRMGPGMHTLVLLLFVIDSNGQEASRTMTTQLACS